MTSVCVLLLLAAMGKASLDLLFDRTSGGVVVRRFHKRVWRILVLTMLLGAVLAWLHRF